MNKIEIIGTGSYAPCRIIRNDDLSNIVDTYDEWIFTRTGIKERRITEVESTSDIASEAARKAIINAKIKPQDIDLIIVGTATPDNFIPSTACIVQKKIGAVNAVCFDISAACSGFIYGMSIGEQFIKTGQYKKALIIGAETLSKIVDWQDRNTCILFGDGAGAAILSTSESEGVLCSVMHSDGNKGELLKCEAVPLSNVFENVKEKETLLNKSIVTMEGREIFKFAVKAIMEIVEELLAKTNLNLEDIKYIVPHQANIRIIEFVAQKLNINKDKFYMNLERFGNTSAASIPLALDEMNHKGLLNNGDNIILVGFGGGLTWGGNLIKWTAHQSDFL